MPGVLVALLKAVARKDGLRQFRLLIKQKGLNKAQHRRPIRHSIDLAHRKAFSDKFLLLTNISLSLGLSTMSDVLEQRFEIHRGEVSVWNLKRTTHMAISGVGIGTLCHYWYRFLDRRLPGRSIAVVVKKIALDQLVCSPIYVAAFFLTMTLLEQESHSSLWEELKRTAWKLYAAEWASWSATQFINFYWLPTRYRVFYDNLISLCYDLFISHLKRIY